MNDSLRRAAACTLALALWSAGCLLPVRGAEPPVRKAHGIETREPWTTSKIHGTPEPPDPYLTEVAFAKLAFDEPLAMCVVPGGDRLAVAERQGKVFTFVGDEKTSTKSLLLDAGKLVIGLTFHPDYAENGQVFVTEVTSGEGDTKDTVEVVRYMADRASPPRVDPASRQAIIAWKAQGHRGGCLEFGPDGMLYFSAGDGSGIADQDDTGQDLGDLQASILRIDVDRPTSTRRYSIPADNPFVGREGARGEVFAYGLRQAWRFAFDQDTGRLWAGDVGQDLWEMIYLIEKGGNYGWSVNEGNHPFRPRRDKGPTAIVPPIVEHPHSDFRSITGGYVYQGERSPELRGAYLYGDYDTGKIWSLRYDGEKVTENRQLVDTQLRVVSFGQDQSGEVYILDFIGGKIHRLAPAPKSAEPESPFPRKLSETGLFASTKDHTMAKGVIPYSVNAPLWSDGAMKDRYLAIPGDGRIEFETVTYPQPAPGSLPGWRFPHDAVLVKTFSLEMEAGDPNSARRLETRILHHKHMPGTDEVGAQFWRGYTYVWNDEQTDAVLLDAEGLDRTFTIKDESAPDGLRKQTWHFPSRSECTLCHTMASKYALGVNTQQMNRDHDYGGVIANQLSTLDHLGMFTKPLDKQPGEMAKLADYHDEQQSVASRARAYLDANCSHCHRKWGGGNADFQLLATLPLSETGTVDARPGQGLFGLEDPRILVPGHPERSLIHHRMKILGLGRMPHIASGVVDEEAVELVRKWIAEME
ncbi:MAG: PQQ-dependent sugar dehydrogenase [Pirellulaceae bacterium]